MIEYIYENLGLGYQSIRSLHISEAKRSIFDHATRSRILIFLLTQTSLDIILSVKLTLRPRFNQDLFKLLAYVQKNKDAS